MAAEHALLEGIEEAMWPFASQIAEREQVLCALALARQKRVAAANARVRRAFVDGIGEVVASIDADIYHRLAATYGYETVNSDDFLRTLLRDNPELRVQSVSRKSGIVVPAGMEEITSADICTQAQPLAA